MPTHPSDDFTFETLPADAVMRFRQAMLWPDKPLDHVRVCGDDTASHVGCHDNGALIAAGSFYGAGAQVRLRKLAVHPQYRRRGLAAAIVRTGAIKVRDQGATQLWCDARQTALGFYTSLGFVIDPEVFEKSGVAYQVARLDLTKVTGPPVA